MNSSKPRFTTSGMGMDETRIGYWRATLSDATNSVVGGPVAVTFYRTSNL